MKTTVKTAIVIVHRPSLNGSTGAWGSLKLCQRVRWLIVVQSYTSNVAWVYLSIYRSIYLSIYRSIYLSIYIYILYRYYESTWGMGVC